MYIYDYYENFQLAYVLYGWRVKDAYETEITWIP